VLSLFFPLKRKPIIIMRTVSMIAAVLAAVCVASVVSASSMNMDALQHVARVFGERGYINDALKELTPQQRREIDAIGAEPVQHHSVEHKPLSLEAEYDDPNFAKSVSSLLETTSEAERAAAHLASSPRGRHHRVSRRHGRTHRRASSSGAAMRFAETPVLDAAKKAIATAKGGNTKKFTVAKAQNIEDCMGCRFVWRQVEMDVSNARYPEDVQASFEHNCVDAQKSSIFFKVCEDMYDDMYAMTDDYMSQDWTVDQMCQRAKMC
jgi:hypothetical protein